MMMSESSAVRPTTTTTPPASAAQRRRPGRESAPSRSPAPSPPSRRLEPERAERVGLDWLGRKGMKAMVSARLRWAGETRKNWANSPTMGGTLRGASGRRPSMMTFEGSQRDQWRNERRSRPCNPK